MSQHATGNMQQSTGKNINSQPESIRIVLVKVTMMKTVTGNSKRQQSTQQSQSTVKV